MTYRSSTNNSIEERSLTRAIPIRVCKNGDKFFPAKRCVVSKRKFPTYESLLQDLTYTLREHECIKRLLTPDHGTEIIRYDDLQPDQIYVASTSRTGTLFPNLSYKDIQSTQRVRSKPRNHDVEPVRHNKEYKDQEGRVAQSYQKCRVKRVTVYPSDVNIDPHYGVIINPNCDSMEKVYLCVQNYFSPALGFRVERLLDFDSHDEILDVQDIVNKGVYIACPYVKVLKAHEDREKYGKRLKNFDTSSPRGPVGTLPPLTKKGYKGSPNTSSVASNPEYKSRNRSQQNGGVHGRPVKHKRTPERRTNDYDRDDGGVFKPKNKSRDTHGAKEVEETHHTKTDLPIDQVQAEEVKDYDDFSVDHDTNLPSDVSLSRKPSVTPHQQIDDDDDDYHDDEEEDEKINSQQINNNAKETTQKANSKQPERRQADQAHAKKDTGRKDSPPPVQKKHSGTRGEFNNVSPLPGIQSNDKRASTPREQKTSSPNAWSDDGRKNAADIKKNAEQIEKENKAATKIQAGVKGHQARKKLAEKKAEIKKEDANIKEDNAKRQKEQDAKSQKQKEDEAATKIQAGFRGHQTRKEIKKQKGEKEVNNAMGYSSGRSRDTLGNDEEEAAATKIQANYRGHKVRKEMNEKKSKKKEEDEEEAAATKIQAGFRGHKARKEVQQRKEEEKAATKIQAGFRGHQVRKELKNNKEGEGNAQGNTSPDVQNQSKAIGDVNAAQGNTQTDVPKG
ncbi:hypothetical protein FSP39_007811 [Pinctada imbricata]|uniref:Doublecortin domain-containing protein n=1 Tax=Pinctada imbricata TaxID=66713 RepID=A0AA89BM08_PINIB|nr:hypothetical protein FSP39_007811 [Pinctada imbricata]